jgi:peptide/nickel transport system substrate-binding protein
VEFVPAGDAAVQLEALGRGEIDVMRDLPQQLVPRARSLPGVVVARRSSLTTYYLWFDAQASPEGAPFADPRVRRAVALAIDRTALVRRLGGLAVPAGQLVQQGVFGHVAGLPELGLDLAEARRLLAEAGHAQGLDVVLAHRKDVPDLVEAAIAVRESLAAAGIRVRLAPRPWSELFADWRAGRAAFFLAGWRFETGDAHSFLVDCVATRDPARNQGLFSRSFSSPELDRLIAAHAELFGDAERSRSYALLAQKAAAEMPLVPLFTRDDLYAVSPRVRFQPRLDSRLLAVEMGPRP